MTFGNKDSKAIPIRQLVGMAFFVIPSKRSIEFQIKSAIMKVTIVG